MCDCRASHLLRFCGFSVLDVATSSATCSSLTQDMEHEIMLALSSERTSDERRETISGVPFQLIKTVQSRTTDAVSDK